MPLFADNYLAYKDLYIQYIQVLLFSMDYCDQNINLHNLKLTPNQVNNDVS